MIDLLACVPRSSHLGTGAAGVADIVRGRSRPATVVAVFEHALYLGPQGTERVVAVVTRDGVLLPNAIVLPVLSAACAIRTWEPPWQVGDGRITAPTVDIVVDAWHETRPGLELREVASFLATLVRLEDAIAMGPAEVAPAELQAACAARDHAGAVVAAQALIGLGPGLTPSGDDVLAGAIAAGLAVTRALGDEAGQRFFRRLGAEVAERAIGRTTTLSQTLLQHAAQGEMAEPARQLTLTLAGTGSFAAALSRLRRVGHTSGNDLAAGIAAGARAAVTSLTHGSEAS